MFNLSFHKPKYFIITPEQEVFCIDEIDKEFLVEMENHVVISVENYTRVFLNEMGETEELHIEYLEE